MSPRLYKVRISYNSRPHAREPYFEMEDSELSAYTAEDAAAQARVMYHYRDCMKVILVEPADSANDCRKAGD